MIVDTDEKHAHNSVSTAVINSKGDVAYRVFERGELIGMRITDGDYSTAIDIGEDFSFYEIPVINDNGSVAFIARVDSSKSPAKLFLYKDGEVTVIAADGADAPYKRIHHGIAINNLNEVAFSVEKHSGETAVLVFADGEIRTFVDDSGPYEAVGSVMGITDGGTVAFTAKSREPCVGGIYTGLDPIADKVIGSGDESDNIQIKSSSVRLGKWGIKGSRIGVGAAKMNNRGEFVFTTDDGTTRLYLAQPINKNQDQLAQRDTPN
jgi:hypothetical protein